MATSLRGVTGNTGLGNTIPVSAHSGTKQGDILVAWHANDGSIQTPLGGGDWQLFVSRSAGALTFRAWWAEAAGNGAAAVTFRQPGGASGVAGIAAIGGGLNDIPLSAVLQASFSGPEVDSPGLAFSARGVEIRLAFGYALEDPCDWDSPSDYTERFDGQAEDRFTAGVVATRTVSAGVETDVETFTASTDLLLGAIAVTIGVLPAPTSGGGEGPPPIQYPPFAPGAGDSFYRTTFRRMLDGDYLGELELDRLEYDIRASQAGMAEAAIPITNDALSDAVDTIIPRDPTELDRGPGVICMDIWRGSGNIAGEYWITGAQVEQGEEGEPVLSLQGCTLDGYLLSLAIEEELEFVDTDIIEIARSLIIHAQSQPNSNLGLQLMGGNAGVTRTITYPGDGSMTYGQALDELTKVAPGFEFIIEMSVQNGALVRTWKWGSPTLGDGTVHTFEQSPEGGSIVRWKEEISVARGGTRFLVRGGTPQAEDATQDSAPIMATPVDAADHLAAGWPRVTRLADHPAASLDQSTLNAYAEQWASKASGALRIRSVTVALGEETTLTPWSIGHDVRLLMTNPWHRRNGAAAGLDITRRLIGMKITAINRANGKERAELFFAEEA